MFIDIVSSGIAKPPDYFFMDVAMNKGEGMVPLD